MIDILSLKLDRSLFNDQLERAVCRYPAEALRWGRTADPSASAEHMIQ
jgi:hypothetical protein